MPGESFATRKAAEIHKAELKLQVDRDGALVVGRCCATPDGRQPARRHSIPPPAAAASSFDPTVPCNDPADANAVRTRSSSRLCVQPYGE
jgi:hypothetical protein